MKWVWLILRCVVILLTGPMIGFGWAMLLTFGVHWLSGEANEISSGQPWAMLGAMLLVPAGTLAGAALGFVSATNAFYAGVESFADDEDSDE